MNEFSEADLAKWLRAGQVNPGKVQRIRIDRDTGEVILWTVDGLSGETHTVEGVLK